MSAPESQPASENSRFQTRLRSVLGSAAYDLIVNDPQDPDEQAQMILQAAHDKYSGPSGYYRLPRIVPGSTRSLGETSIETPAFVEDVFPKSLGLEGLPSDVTFHYTEKGTRWLGSTATCRALEGDTTVAVWEGRVRNDAVVEVTGLLLTPEANNLPLNRLIGSALTTAHFSDLVELTAEEEELDFMAQGNRIGWIDPEGNPVDGPAL